MPLAVRFLCHPRTWQSTGKQKHKGVVVIHHFLYTGPKLCKAPGFLFVTLHKNQNGWIGYEHKSVHNLL
jgi:hypothetical protein